MSLKFGLQNVVVDQIVEQVLTRASGRDKNHRYSARSCLCFHRCLSVSLKLSVVYLTPL